MLLIQSLISLINCTTVKIIAQDLAKMVTKRISTARRKIQGQIFLQKNLTNHIVQKLWGKVLNELKFFTNNVNALFISKSSHSYI